MKSENALDSLPTIDVPRTCKACGSEDYGVGEADRDTFETVLCDKCPGIPKEYWLPTQGVH